MPVAARSNVWVCGRSLSGIADSNPAGGMYVYPLCMFCIVEVQGPCDDRSLPGVYVFRCVWSNDSPLHQKWVGRRGTTERANKITFS